MNIVRAQRRIRKRSIRNVRTLDVDDELIQERPWAPRRHVAGPQPEVVFLEVLARQMSAQTTARQLKEQIEFLGGGIVRSLALGTTGNDRRAQCLRRRELGDRRVERSDAVQPRSTRIGK